MGYARVRGVGLVGHQGHPVTVEAFVSRGLPGMVISGLPDASVSEARDRIRAAIANSDEAWPKSKITVNLLPADLPKKGTGFDVALAVVILAAANVLPLSRLRGTALIGELGLDGLVRPVRGVLPMVTAVVAGGIGRVVVPSGNAAEASFVPDVEVVAPATLRELIEYARAGVAVPEPPRPDDDSCDELNILDLVDVVGQPRGRAALALAAAGRHHLALFGPPGAGKTMLAQRLPSILPPLSDDAALEVTALHSVAGTLPAVPRLIRRPPFSAPHHTASAPALIGGGSGLPRPGALSLAHQGVLFLDEAPHFAPSVLNALRQPLEQGWVTICRAQGTIRFPARIQLVLASNPCPCGSPRDAGCSCSPLVRRNYLARLSGPLLDRVDLQVQLAPVGAAALLGGAEAQETSAQVLKRVLAAREAAHRRWAPCGLRVNAQVPGAVLRTPPFRLPGPVTAELAHQVDLGLISARGYDRVLRVAWTIADMSGRVQPDAGDVLEALQLRTGEFR